MNNQFAENLKKIRKENNLSQEQLADELGVSRQAISKWESAVAYPEMDKIIALCNIFNLNIDDLLHKDIKEVKGEEESKKKINSIVDDFLKYITNTINLFSNMNFKSKIKCLFEQFVIAGLLYLIAMFIFLIFESLFGKIFGFLPDRAYFVVTNFFEAIIIIALLIVSIIVIAHIFKTRYLDYYEKIKEDNSLDTVSNDSKNKETPINNVDNDNEKIQLKKNDNKIIIRDPKDSEYKFIHFLFKCIIGIIKLFSLWFGLLIAVALIGLFAAFVITFMLRSTGVFFIGLLVTILSSSVIAIILLLSILNFVFNRKSDKKKMIWSGIISLITFGIGCGLITTGAVSFNVIEDNDSYLKTVTKEYEMKDDLLLDLHSGYEIEYVSSDNSNVKIDYSISKYCKLEDSYDDNNLIAWVNCENPTKIVREVIKLANDKKIVLISNEIEKITVYTTQENIDKLKNNWSIHLERIKKQ